MYRMLFLALKRVPMVKNTSCQIATTQQKISIVPTGEKGLPLNVISKSTNFPVAQEEDYLGKLTIISITFVNP